jgi:hypothetical protein
MNYITIFFILTTAYNFGESGAPTKSKISASIKDKNVRGMEDLNLNLVIPFKIQDYIIGFKCAIKGLTQLPG